jgi:hypothetical protein
LGADDAVSGGSSPVAFLSFFLLLENSPIAYVCSRRVAIVLGFAVRRGSDPASCGCCGGARVSTSEKGILGDRQKKKAVAKGKLARKNVRSVCLPSLGQR